MVIQALLYDVVGIQSASIDFCLAFFDRIEVRLVASTITVSERFAIHEACTRRQLAIINGVPLTGTHRLFDNIDLGAKRS